MNSEIHLDASDNKVYLQDDNGDYLWVIGTTVPADTTTGYAKSCIFLDSDVATGTGSMYLNK